MPRVQREATVTWEGNVARGSGAISAATGAFSDLPYSLASRVERPDGKTSPEELLAAAHAACYAMSLAGELAGAGTPAERGDYKLADETYDKLLDKLREREFAGMSDALRADLRRHFGAEVAAVNSSHQPMN